MPFLHLGASLIELGMAADAVPAYREAVRLDPANADNRRRLVALLSKLGRAEEARAEADAASRLGGAVGE